ncbi:MAG TPA: helix-turn-helix transcriptional regulator [Streptosporangiaceae bacterium]|nr:helix-turn-helix transcriptional regulator [Streptosporangiaceae bacterium]
MADWWLGEETTGELISRARERLGKSQYALAEAMQESSRRSDGVPDRTMVARWETGRRIPTPYWRVHLAAVLQLPVAELDRAAAVTKARRASDSQQPADVDSSERIRHVLTHPGTVDLVSVAYLREQVRRLDEQYDRAPSTALIPETGQHLGQISFLGAHARRSYVRKELHAAEAEAATLMGQLVWDASQRSDHDTAVAYFDQAARAAQEHGDKPAEGLALLRKSFVALYGRRDPGAGLSLTQHTAHTTADASQVLTGLAMLHVAEAHAMLGDRRACEQALDAASGQIARIQPGDPAIDLFSPTQPGRLAGSCYLFLRDAQGAAAILEETALSLRDHSKSQAVVLGNLALAYIRLGQLDAAVARLNTAIDVTERHRGGGGLTIICAAGRQLRPWRGNSEVQDVYDRIMTLMAA